MTTRHVLHPIVELRVVRDVASGRVVRAEISRAADRGLIEASDELASVNDILGGLGERDELGLAGREGDTLLLARAPGERRVAPHDNPARGGVLDFP